MNTMTFENTHLRALEAEGYFVQIFGNGSEPGSLIIDCNIYLMDTAEDGSPTKPFCFDRLTQPLRDHEGACICCEETGERQWTNGSVACPLCHTWAKRSSIVQRSFRGIFKIVLGEPAILIPHTVGPLISQKWMTAESHHAKRISEVLSDPDVLNLFSISEKQAAGWLMTDQQAAGLMAIQERLRAAEAAEEAAVIQEASKTGLPFFATTPYDDMPLLIDLDEYDDMPALIPIEH